MDDMVREQVLAHVTGITADELLDGDEWMGELRMPDGRRFMPLFERGSAVLETRPDGSEVCWRAGEPV